MAAKPAPKKAVTSTIPTPTDKEEEDYIVSGESKEDISADLDAFERRLEGQKAATKPAAKKAAPARAVPASNMPPMVAPKDYKKVNPTSMTEDEEDKMEALKAVSELEKFEQRLGNA